LSAYSALLQQFALCIAIEHSAQTINPSIGTGMLQLGHIVDWGSPIMRPMLGTMTASAGTSILGAPVVGLAVTSSTVGASGRAPIAAADVTGSATPTAAVAVAGSASIKALTHLQPQPWCAGECEHSQLQTS
jgi:hypothetical protein